MDASSDRPFEVLVVEDDPAHARLVEVALAEVDVTLRVSTARDGERALGALKERAGRPPDLVLLDLNPPGLGGHAVLAAIRADERLSALREHVLGAGRR